MNETEPDDGGLESLLGRIRGEYPNLNIEIVDPQSHPYFQDGRSFGFFNLDDQDGSVQMEIKVARIDEEFFQKLKEKRPVSIALIEFALAIEPGSLTPQQLQRYALFHELGHFNDFWSNFARHGEQDLRKASEEFRERHKREVSNLIAGRDPSSFHQSVEILKSGNLDRFFPSGISDKQKGDLINNWFKSATVIKGLDTSKSGIESIDARKKWLIEHWKNDFLVNYFRIYWDNLEGFWDYLRNPVVSGEKES